MTKVTKEPVELAILLELLMFEKVPTQQHLEHEQKKEGEIIGSKNDFFPQRERASDTQQPRFYQQKCGTRKDILEPNLYAGIFGTSI